MPRCAASLRNLPLSASSIRVLWSQNAVGSVGTPPHWRTQACGAALLHHVEQRLAHLREQMHVLMAVDEVRRLAELA